MSGTRLGAKKAAQTAKKRHGSDFHRKIGYQGGQATSAKHNSAFYKAIGRQGGTRRHMRTNPKQGET